MMKASPLEQASSFAGSVLSRYHRELFRFLLRRLRSREDVQDLAQEVYLRLLRVESGAEIHEPLAYVYRTASNVVTEFRMRKYREGKRVQFDSEATERAAEASADFSADQMAEQMNMEAT